MIHCTRCGARMRIANSSGGDNPLADALNVITRTRGCGACGETTHTTEMRSNELSELRRQAYLWQRHEAEITSP